MRCPVCVMNQCICAPGVQLREIRKSFDRAAYWARPENADEGRRLGFTSAATPSGEKLG